MSGPTLALWWAAAGVSCAWLLFVAGLLAVARGARRDHRADLGIALALAVAASVTLSLPDFGPMGFAGGSRFSELGTRRLAGGRDLLALRVPLLGAIRAGSAPVTAAIGFFRGMGVAVVVAVFFCARAAGLDRAAATLAAALLLCWPSFIRYANDLSDVVPTAALAVTLTALVLAADVAPTPRSRPLLVTATAAATLLLCARPEAPLSWAALLFVPRSASPRRALVVGAAVAALLVAPIVVTGTSAPPVSFGSWARVWNGVWRSQFGLTDPSLGPVVLYPVAVAGLFLARSISLRLRTAWACHSAALLVLFPAVGFELNPVWGQSRYYVLLLPATCVLAAALIDRLLPLRARGAVLAAAAIAGPAGSIAGWWSLIGRPMDLQQEYAFLIESAATWRDAPALVAVDGGCMARRHFPAEDLTVVPLGIADVPAQSASCGPRASGARSVTALSLALDVCPEVLDGALVYLGGLQPSACLEPLRARFALTPVATRVVRAAVASPLANDVCTPGGVSDPTGVFQGNAADDCTYTVGWYAVSGLPTPGATP